jgi:serine/threonine protein kinase
MSLAENQVPAEWKVGDVILDLYEIKDIHEGGGMGLVYRVHHRGWHMDLAVKSPRAEFFRTERQKENFIHECETWISLGLHPHVASCFYVRNLGNIPRIFAEYVEGGTLKDWIETGKLYEGGPEGALKRILDIAIQIAWGLQFAHERGLIHQDVKPANILMTPNGTAKVTDFGLTNARATAGESPASGGQRSILASSGGMTPAYCSPEQAENYAKRASGVTTDSLAKLTRRTDIWSWAVVALELFIGEVCWQSGAAAPVVLDQYQELKRDGLPEIPADLHKLLSECFRTDPDLRPRGFSDVAGRLLQIYLSVTGENYWRQHPAVAELMADGLNNRAVSLLDLGKHAEAEALLNETLQKHPGHPQATYNLGLIRWRAARGTDADLLAALKQAQQNHPNDATVFRLLGLVHLERGDMSGAASALESAKGFGAAAVVDSSLHDARRLLPVAPRCVRVLGEQE